MKYFIAALTFLLFSPLVFAQDNEENRYYYVGKIGDLSIQMELQLEGSDVRGSFYYERGGSKGGARRSALGQINPEQSTINLVVKGEGGSLETSRAVSNVEGEIAAKFTPIGGGLGTIIEGKYTDKSTLEKLPLKLTKVANYEFSMIKQGKEGENRYYEASWSYPKLISRNEVIQKVTIKLRDSMKPKIDEFFKDAKEMFMGNMMITYGWAFDYSYSIEYYSDELISFTGQVYSYMGGAHGNTYFASSNYSLSETDSKLLKLSDLFKKGSNYAGVLSDLIIKDLKKQNAGWVTEGEIKSFKEDEIGPFALSPEGIQFAFAPYAVGPYAEGPYFVTLSYESLKSVIDPNGPLSQFINSKTAQEEQ